MGDRHFIDVVMGELEETNHDKLQDIASLLYFSDEHNVYLMGNGGSSATMSHLASDLRKLGLRATCLTDNIPQLTAYTNDYGWDLVYAKMIGHLLEAKDIIIMASVNGSSGKSPDGTSWSSNLFNLAKLCKDKEVLLIGFIGNDGGQLVHLCDFSVCTHSKNPYIVESVHSVWAHEVAGMLKEMVDGDY